MLQRERKDLGPGLLPKAGRLMARRPEAVRTFVYFDGATEPTNPGPSAYGVIALDAETGENLHEMAGFLGEATNNVAEFAGLESALTWALDHPERAPFVIRGDSQFVIKTITEGWRTHKEHLVEPTRRTRELAFRLGAFLEWVPREQNGEADLLSKAPLGVEGPGREEKLAAWIEGARKKRADASDRRARYGARRDNRREKKIRVQDSVGRSVNLHAVPLPPNLRRPEPIQEEE